MKLSEALQVTDTWISFTHTAAGGMANASDKKFDLIGRILLRHLDWNVVMM
jgi:hypothetical protein